MAATVIVQRGVSFFRRFCKGSGHNFYTLIKKTKKGDRDSPIIDWKAWKIRGKFLLGITG